MFSRKQILSAMAGVAMLALPVSAFAEHHDNNWNHPRRHDQGFHKGWVNHQIAPVVPPRYGRAYNRYQWTPPAGWYGTPARGPLVNYDPPASRPYGWNNGYRRECDGDGDRCEWEANTPPPAYQPYAAPNYRYNPGSWNENEDENYGGSPSSYQQQPPAGYNQSQSLSWLMAKRQRTMATIAQLRARHDSRGAARLVPVVTGLNRRIAALNPRLGYNAGYGYAPAANYGAPVNYAAPASSLINALPYNGGALPYNGGAYSGNPTVDALSSLAVPLLSGVR